MWATVAVGRHDTIHRESDFSKGFVKDRAVTKAHGPDGIAVVAAFDRKVSRGDFGAGSGGVLMV